MPCAADAAPAMTFRSDVLPAPLRPTRPTLSPGCSENDASVRVWRPPTSTASSRTWSTDNYDVYGSSAGPGLFEFDRLDIVFERLAHLELPAGVDLVSAGTIR